MGSRPLTLLLLLVLVASTATILSGHQLKRKVHKKVNPFNAAAELVASAQSTSASDPAPATTLPLPSAILSANNALLNTNLDKALNVCQAKYEQLEGTPWNTSVQATERLCWYNCVVRTNQWYNWDSSTNICKCFSRENITGITSYGNDKSVYRVFGYMTVCFPFCSVAVSKCSRCNVKGGGVACVFNFSQRRCCCVPPAKAVIRKGFIVACTKNMSASRSTRELAEASGAADYLQGLFGPVYNVTQGPFTDDGTEYPVEVDGVAY